MANYGQSYSAYRPGTPTSDSTVEFQKLAQAAGSSIQRIVQHVNSIRKVVSQIGTPQDSGQLTGQLQDLLQNAKKQAEGTKSQMEQLVQMGKNASSPAEQRKRRGIVDKLAEELTQVLNQLQKSQRDAVDKEKESVQRARSHSAASAHIFADDSFEDYNSGQSAVAKQQSLQAVADEEENLQAITEREEAIRRLQSDIMGVNEIFKDLSTMILEQGEMIDSIDMHVEQTVVHVEQANTQLVQAKEYQTSARKKKCICIAVLVVALLVITLIIVLSVVLKGKNSN